MPTGVRKPYWRGIEEHAEIEMYSDIVTSVYTVNPFFPSSTQHYSHKAHSEFGIFRLLVAGRQRHDDVNIY